MSFSPYSFYYDAAPILKPAHYLQIGGTMYIVIYPRGPFRRSLRIFADPGKAQPVNLALTDAGQVRSDGTAYSVGGFAGDITTRQIVVNLRYFAVSKQNPPVRLAWGDFTELFSEIKPVPLDNTTAGTANPLQLDLWSFDQSMQLTVTVDNTQGTQRDFQDIFVDMVEYKVAPVPENIAAQVRRYILLTARGWATAPIERASPPPSLEPLEVKEPKTGTVQGKPSVQVKEFRR